MQPQKEAQADELFFVVDEHDQPLAPLPRKLVHGHGVWHRVSHVWVLNAKGQVLCQQRSLLKETSPGKWEPFLGGHLAPGEPYDQGAARELAEEIGIEHAPDELTLWKIYKFHSEDNYNNEFQGVFTTQWEGDPAQLAIDKQEVEQLRWYDAAEVRENVQTNNPSWVRLGYELDLLADLAS